MNSSSASSGRLVAGAAIINAARRRGLTMPPPNLAEPLNVAQKPALAPAGRMNEVSQPVCASDHPIAAVRPPQAPVRRDPDRDLKFGDLLRGLQACCEAFSEPPRPLAVGIRRQIVELVGDQFEPWLVAKLCRWWTNRPDYLQAVAAGGERINLDGSSAGEISDSHRAHAHEKLAEWQRRKAEERNQASAAADF